MHIEIINEIIRTVLETNMLFGTRICVFCNVEIFYLYILVECMHNSKMLVSDILHRMH